MNKKDGGPAFARGVGVDGTTDGISIRDWFAGIALNGLLQWESKIVPSHNEEDAINYFPQAAYKIADAMMRVREK